MSVSPRSLTNSSIATASPWEDCKLPGFAALERDLDCDEVVIGAGLAGITAAWLLGKSGRKVALLDRSAVGSADTAHTTAHLTCVTDARLHELVRHFGEEGARAIWEAGAAAIDQIAEIVSESGADCGFRRVPGYLHARVRAPAQDLVGLREDAAFATRFGFDAEFLGSVPHMEVPGVRFAEQAAFHPGRYLAALLPQLAGLGCQVFEHTTVESIEERPRRVRVTEGHEIRCGKVVITTHNPLSGSLGALRAALFQTKLSLYTS